MVAGVPVGGLDQPQAVERLLQAYGTPVELIYEGESMVLSPSQVGFQLNTEAMMAAGELERTNTDFWSGFWDYLWNRPGELQTVPLRAEYSDAQLEAALLDIAARYDEPPVASRPVPGSAEFEPGHSGRVLDVTRAIELVGEVLTVPSDRNVNLPVLERAPSRANLATLETLLKQNLDIEQYDGLAVFYIRDLRTGEELHFGYFQNEDISVVPDIAFDAGSTIKIGIATAFYRYFDEPLDEEASRWLSEMITLSGNDPANWLMERIDRDRGPLLVTETLNELLGKNIDGERTLASSFIAAWFRPPEIAIPGARATTPSNQRLDINTRPNQLNQTTPSELGMLLADLYACEKGGGALLAVFPNEVKPEECANILSLLSQNRIAWLIEASVPDGIKVAHKHGWDSPLDYVTDAGIVYSPGGDYVISISLWNGDEMVWEPTSSLFAQLGRAIYNYFNPPAG